MDINLKTVLASDITDTVGASAFLTERLGRNISVDTVHNLVREGRLPSYIFQRGELTPRPPEQPIRGKDLIFLKVHLQAMEPPPRPGNPTFATRSGSVKSDKTMSNPSPKSRKK